MFSPDDLTEAPVLQAPKPIVIQASPDDRRRPGRQTLVAPELLPLLRDPAKSPVPDAGSAVVAQVLAVAVTGLIVGLGYLMRGVP